MSQRDGAPDRSILPPDPLKSRFRKSLSSSFAGLGAWLVRLICKTSRVDCVDEERFFGIEGGKILCLWHGRPIAPTARMIGVELSVLISLSRDGELINAILSSLGFGAVRGSSGPSGARALASCIKLLRNGEIVVVTPDGPRGPSGVAQPGVMTMARKSGRPIVPIGCSSRPRIVLKSWDRFMVPLPFSRSVILFGEPVYVPEDADEATLEALRGGLQAEMRRLQDDADRRLRVPTFAEIVARKTLK